MSVFVCNLFGVCVQFCFVYDFLFGACVFVFVLYARINLFCVCTFVCSFVMCAVQFCCMHFGAYVFF